MAEWKKIIVSGSNAHLNQITASGDIPLKFTGNVTGSNSTVPLVLDSNGNVATGSAYAVQGSDDFVNTSGTLTANRVIVGDGGSGIKISDTTVNFGTHGITNIGSIALENNSIINGANAIFSNDDIKIGNDTDTDTGQIVLRGSADLEFLNESPGSSNTQVISSSISTLFLFGDANRLTPVIKYHANDSEAALTDRIIFEDSVSNRNYAIQTKQNTDATKAEFALVNNESDKVIHVSGSRVGIGTLANGDFGLSFVGGLSGSGGAFIKDIHTDPSLDTDGTFTKTLVYDSATGRIAAESSTNLGGVTGVSSGTNITVGGSGNVTVNLDASLNNMTGIDVSTISGSNILLVGSGSNANGFPDDDSTVRVTNVSASNLLVQEDAVFNGSFLFTGFDFTVENATVQSGSTLFGSGSDVGTTTHTFTGSMFVTGALNIDTVNAQDVNVSGDLDVDGTSNLDNTNIDGTLNVTGGVTLGNDASADNLTVNAISTLNGEVILAKSLYVSSSGDHATSGQITGSSLRLESLTAAADLTDKKFVVISSSGDLQEATLGTLTLDDISVSAGSGINVNGSTISVNSSSMDLHFRSASLTMVDGDVTFADGNSDGTFTSTLGNDTVEANNIDFFWNTADDSIGNGEILISSGSAGTQKFAKKAITGVIAISDEGVTSFTEAANIDTANQASASLITSASHGQEFSILLTDKTTGDVTQSLKVDGTPGSDDFKYNTGTNVLTVGGSTFGNDVVVAGDLTVNGSTVTLNTETLTVDDNFIVLNSNLTDADGTGVGGGAVQDSGISINRGNQATASFYWDESNNRWSLSQAATPGAGDATPEVSPDALVMFVYTENNATPPANDDSDNPDGWHGYTTNNDASKRGATYITSNGDIFIYA